MDVPLIHFVDVESLLCRVALTVCAGVCGSEPVTVMVFPALTLEGTEIVRVLLWHSDEVAPDFGAVTAANAITATANARTPIVSAFLIILLRRATGPAARACAATFVPVGAFATDETARV
jgi:hypothetical protein